MNSLPDYSDYIIFADESGDHGLINIDEDFPAFALSFCMIKKSEYISKVVPNFQDFKFYFWGNDTPILHEHDIRKSKGPFSLLLTNKELRQNFYDRLNNLIAETEMTIFASVIDKIKLKTKYNTPKNPYEIALLFCMERLLDNLLKLNQENKTIHVIFESRARKEDSELELEFLKICNNQGNWGHKSPNFTKIKFKPLFVSKKANSTGLQLADLVARPIALSYLRPDQNNRAFGVIEPKISDIKVFP